MEADPGETEVKEFLEDQIANIAEIKEYQVLALG